MRTHKSMFERVRGRLRKRRRASSALSPALRDWAPWLWSDATKVDRFREEMASRLSRDAGLETLEEEAGSDWSDLLTQRARERATFAERGLRVPALYPGESAPTVLSAEFLNMIPREIEALIEASKPPRKVSLPGFAVRACRGALRWLRRS